MGRRLLDIGGKAKAAGIGAKAAAATGAAIVALVVCAGLAGGSTSSGASSVECRATADNSQIPADYFPWLPEAAAKYHLGPKGAAIVAAIHYVESDWGQSTLPGVAAGTQNYMGAEGPGQFLVPSWEAYGVDADGDGVKDPYSVPDSVFATAHLLHEDGAPKEWRQAIWDYNHAWWYVEEVLEKAETLKMPMVCEATSAELGVGAARSLERIKAVAKWIEEKRIHYCWGGGHGPKPGRPPGQA